MQSGIASFLRGQIRHKELWKEAPPALAPDGARDLYIFRDCAFDTRTGWMSSNWSMFRWFFPDVKAGLYQLFVDRARDGGEVALHFSEGPWKAAGEEALP